LHPCFTLSEAALSLGFGASRVGVARALLKD
jgi:hypothetical protein